MRGEVAKETLGWLRDHPHDSSVRTQPLAFLLKLPVGVIEIRRLSVTRGYKYINVL